MREAGHSSAQLLAAVSSDDAQTKSALRLGATDHVSLRPNCWMSVCSAPFGLVFMGEEAAQVFLSLMLYKTCFSGQLSLSKLTAELGQPVCSPATSIHDCSFPS